ncbi:MAG: NADP oxidoreductase, partial [Trueperaceae bacterium]|nr:NADP oxidoreductase [Trueperaceae bacterium]
FSYFVQFVSASAAAAASDPATAKNIEVMRDFARRELSGKPRRIHLRFFVSPVEITGDGAVEAVKLERNKLEIDASGYQNAVGTGEYETLPVGMVLRSVGYRGVALPGVPFDPRRGVIPNRGGRVLEEAGSDAWSGASTSPAGSNAARAA